MRVRRVAAREQEVETAWVGGLNGSREGGT